MQNINPQLIYLSVTGFGQSRPYSHKPGYDYIFRGMGGLMSYTGIANGEVLTGENIAATQAQQWGLINECLSQEKLDKRIMDKGLLWSIQQS